MPLLEQNRPLDMRGSSAYPQLTPEQKQRRQMLIALGLLMLALLLVIVKDKDFWFPSSQIAETPVPAKKVAAPSKPAVESTAAKPQVSKPHTKTPSVVIARESINSAPNAPVVTNRAVLPPLEIEVIAGNQPQNVQEKNNSVGLAMGAEPNDSLTQAPTANEVVSNASQSEERVRLSTDTTQVVTHPVEPNYPLLAKEMKVQGSVVLQALIGRDGRIQNLQIVSGPKILSAAAREAVQQWRFKPYYQSGQAVETVARITVNFTISAN